MNSTDFYNPFNFNSQFRTNNANTTEAMISARIIEISDKVKVKYYKLPKVSIYYDLIEYHKYRDSRTIAEVENVKLIQKGVFELRDFGNVELFFPYCPELNQQVFIEPVGEGKVKIVKI